MAICFDFGMAVKVQPARAGHQTGFVFLIHHLHGQRVKRNDSLGIEKALVPVLCPECQRQSRDEYREPGAPDIL